MDADEHALGKLGRHAGVVPAEVPDPDDSDPEHGVPSRRGVRAEREADLG